MIAIGVVNDGEVERRRSNSPAHQSFGRIADTHKPSRRVVIGVSCEVRSLDVRKQREDRPHYCKKFMFGSLVSPSHVSQRARPIADCCPTGRISVFLLLKDGHADLISRGFLFMEE